MKEFQKIDKSDGATNAFSRVVYAVKMSAQYMRDYRAMIKRARSHADKRLWQAGIEALRKQAMDTFRRVGNGEMTGYTAMEIMRELKPSE